MKLVTLMTILFISLPALVGCVSIGNEVKSDQLATFTKGKTTIEEVTTALGQPISSTATSDGRRIINYAFMHNQSRPESIIPAVGAFAGSADMRTRYVMFTFDKDGVMENYTQSEFSSGMGMSLIGGEYRATDVALPQEQPK
jgi:hypothetical protein